MRAWPLFPLLFILLCASAWGADYYVDYDSGSDSNDGLSTATAWKTTSKVHGFAFSPGDSILFKRGETWVDSTFTITESGTEEAPITIGAYGTGDRPLFDNSGIGSGYTTIVPNSADNVTIQDISFILPLEGTSSAIISLYSDNLTIQRVDITRGASVIQIRGGTGLYISDCEITSPSNAGIAILGTETDKVRNTLVENCTLVGSGQDGISIHGGGEGSLDSAGANHIIRGCVGHDNGENSYDFDSGTNVLLEDCEAYSDGQVSVMVGARSSGVTISKCKIHDTRFGMSLAGASTVSQCLFYGTNSAASVAISSANVNILNNTFDTGGYYAVDFSVEAGTTITIKNNLIFDTPAFRNLHLTLSFDEPSWDFDYNLYYKSTGENRIFYNGPNTTLYTFANYRSTFGQGANSIFEEPSFVGDTFVPTADSPVVDAGVDIGLTADFIGTAIPQGLAPDIGAYEYIVEVPEEESESPLGLVKIRISENKVWFWEE